MDRGEVLELGKKCRRQACLRDREVGPDRAPDLRRQPPIPASHTCDDPSRACDDRSRADRDVVALGQQSFELFGR